MINSPTASSEWSISPPLDTGSNSFTPPNRSVRSCSQPQRRDRRGRVPRLRNSQDNIGAGPPVQFSPVACCNCSYKEGIHLRMALGDKTDVNGIRIGPPLFEPEEEASVISEAFKVWVTILAFIVQKICDPERLESLRVKRNRTRKITHGHDDVVEHRIPPCRVGKGSLPAATDSFRQWSR